MRYRLGLDMGTNSIGFAVIKIDSDNQPIDLEDLGVRVFHDGRNPKDNQPLALQRRMARQLRRQNDRRKVRKRQIVNALVQNGLFPASKDEQNSLKDLDPYKLRTEALDIELKPYELGRAIFHLGARRGFESNRICNQEDVVISDTQGTTNKKLTQADKINKLTEDIESSGCRTLGEFLYKRISENNTARFRGDSFEGYPSRQLYKNEFDLIKNKQQEYFKNVNWNQIYDAIFTQRPLKAQEKGRCEFYKDEYRAYLCLPSSQKFRIASEVNNLKYYDLSGVSCELTGEQKDCLMVALDDCKSKNFNSIRKLLKLDYKFNLENGKRTELKGNSTSYTLRKEEYFGHQWDEIPLEIQDEIVNLLLDSETNEEILENDYFNNFCLTDTQKTKILALVLPKTIGHLSTKFMNDCLPLMEKLHMRYDEAVASLGMHHSCSISREVEEQLPYYGQVLEALVSNTHPDSDSLDVEYKFGKIANPTVHIALNQLRRVVNDLISRYGRPEQIVVELSRDISESAEGRARLLKQQKDNEKRNLAIVEEIRSISGIANPSGWDIKKYKLWEELGTDSISRRCPYCGKVITAKQLFTKEIEIEHILPYSRTLMDSMNNLTIAHSTCNLKKGNLTPYEAFSSSPEGFNWLEIVDRAQHLPNGKGKLFTKDAIKPFEEQGSDFLDRQLNDNRYISKAARDYLACICPENHIWGTPGKVTAKLRKNWGLNSILCSDGNYKTRSDHRHHAIDALVIGLTDRGLLQKIAVANKSNIDVTNIAVPDMPFSRQKVVEKVKSINVSIKPNHSHQGRIFLETATGLKLVRKETNISDVTEKDFTDGLLVNQNQSKFIAVAIDNGKSYKQALKALIEQEKVLQKVDNPVTEIFEKVWVTRKELSSLDEKDIIGGRIFNKTLEKLIIEKTKDVISDKKALSERLIEISKELNIKRVRYIPYSQEFEQIHTVPNKWYQLDGVCFATVWKMPGAKEKYVSEFINYKQIYKYDSGKIATLPKPHPAAKKMITLYKDDVIKVQPKSSKDFYFARVAGFSTTQNKVDLQPIKSSESIKEWKLHTNVSTSSDWYFWDKLVDGQNFKSINALFNENNISIANISPSGRIIF